MQAALDSLPVKPKRNRATKVRLQRVFSDLLLRFRIFEALAADGEGGDADDDQRAIVAGGHRGRRVVTGAAEAQAPALSA